jgi:uncharacterized membrane protein
VIDLRLNEMSYWLTVVATIFLPLTFVTGFFGMNFEWMIGQIDTQFAFWLLGLGTSLAAALIAWRTVLAPIADRGRLERRRRSAPCPEALDEPAEYRQSSNLDDDDSSVPP